MDIRIERRLEEINAAMVLAGGCSGDIGLLGKMQLQEIQDLGEGNGIALEFFAVGTLADVLEKLQKAGMDLHVRFHGRNCSA